MSLLEVSNLRIRLQTHRGPADAVRGVSFSLARGETLGLIGESGCGKSITAMALLGLLPEQSRVSGSIGWPSLRIAQAPARSFEVIMIGETPSPPRAGRSAASSSSTRGSVSTQVCPDVKRPGKSRNR